MFNYLGKYSKKNSLVYLHSSYNQDQVSGNPTRPTRNVLFSFTKYNIGLSFPFFVFKQKRSSCDQHINDIYFIVYEMCRNNIKRVYTRGNQNH